MRKWCVISPILFLITIDWVMKKSTSDKSRGIQRDLLTHLEDLDYADDLAILSTNFNNMQEKSSLLNKYSNQTGLHISTTKTKAMKINSKATSQIKTGDTLIEYVEEFTYLGSLISTDNVAQKDIKARLGKTRITFSILRPIWNSNLYFLKTKIQIFNSNVKSVLLYGSECWRMIQNDLKKIQGFYNEKMKKFAKSYSLTRSQMPTC